MCIVRMRIKALNHRYKHAVHMKTVFLYPNNTGKHGAATKWRVASYAAPDCCCCRYFITMHINLPSTLSQLRCHCLSLPVCLPARMFEMIKKNFCVRVAHCEWLISNRRRWRWWWWWRRWWIIERVTQRDFGKIVLLYACPALFYFILLFQYMVSSAIGKILFNLLTRIDADSALSLITFATFAFMGPI